MRGRLIIPAAGHGPVVATGTYLPMYNLHLQFYTLHTSTVQSGTRLYCVIQHRYHPTSYIFSIVLCCAIISEV